MKPQDLSPSEQVQAARLRRMRMIPTALLLAMAVCFLLMMKWGDPLGGYGIAFAEAAMVGALADWFAVVALFRHPLGIPIPHTAIIPRRKNEIGHNLSSFVSEHFLTEEVVRARLAGIDLTGRLAQWLGRPGNSQRVARELARFLSWWLRALDQKAVRQFIQRTLGEHLSQIELAPLAGRILGALTQDGRHHALVTQVLRQAVIYLDGHKHELRRRIRDESPWWMPGFIDDRIAEQLVERVKTVLFSMALDPEHELRIRLDASVKTYVYRLQHSAELRVYAETLKKEALNNPDLGKYLEQILDAARKALISQAENPDSEMIQGFASLLEHSAEELGGDRRLRRLLNAWLSAALVRLVEDHGDQIGKLISDTIATWDAQATSRRIELQVGSDLQFIRINGTLVGGLVGLLIHWVSSLF